MSILLYGTTRLEVHERLVLRMQALALRPRWVANGDWLSPRLRNIKLWECPACRRRWHWPKRPEACGFCQFTDQGE